MKKTLTADRLKELLNYNPDTGVFIWAKNRRKRKRGEVSGSWHKDGYRKIKVDGRDYQAHRLAWLYVTGEWPQFTIDHIDGNRGNNVWRNLRDVPHAVNQQNRKTHQKSSTNGFMGVTRSGKRWTARIRLNGERKGLGVFDTPELAHNAYIAAKRELHEACTI